MAGVTQEHENIFQSLLQTVDNAGTRATLSHVWEVLKEVAGVALPVVEAAAPEVTPVVNATAATVEELDAQIQALLTAKAAKLAAN